MLILSMLFYQLKWFLVHGFSNNEQRISDNEQRTTNNEQRNKVNVILIERCISDAKSNKKFRENFVRLFFLNIHHPFTDLRIRIAF
jgi:hypothetical protein